MSLPAQPAGKQRAVWYGLVEEDDAASPLPSEINTVDHPRLSSLSISQDKLTVKYVGRGNHSQDVGAVRTDWPCPPRCLLYYFEVAIVDSGARGAIAVGFADGHFKLNRQPGWEPDSYAYHGYDGRRYADSERGEPYGPRVSTGDVVGCGLLAERREVFFTRNGQHLGVAFTEVGAMLYPTVGLHSPGEKGARMRKDPLPSRSPCPLHTKRPASCCGGGPSSSLYLLPLSPVRTQLLTSLLVASRVRACPQ